MIICHPFGIINGKIRVFKRKQFSAAPKAMRHKTSGALSHALYAVHHWHTTNAMLYLSCEIVHEKG
jgi:hypothetical protein